MNRHGQVDEYDMEARTVNERVKSILKTLRFMFHKGFLFLMTCRVKRGKCLH